MVTNYEIIIVADGSTCVLQKKILKYWEFIHLSKQIKHSSVMRVLTAPITIIQAFPESPESAFFLIFGFYNCENYEAMIGYMVYEKIILVMISGDILPTMNQGPNQQY
jgi:hypothetical protein